MDTHSELIARMLEVIDNALTAALREVRRARASAPVVETKRRTRALIKRTSQTGLCLDLLYEAGRPLHVSALIEGLAARGVKANRDSLVSALSKRIAPRGPFIRTAGNTYGLVTRDTPVSEVR